MNITTEMVEKVLVDFHNSGEYFDEIDVIEISDKFNNGNDISLDNFIKMWAFAYGFDRYFDTREDESAEEVACDFIEDNKFDYLEMLQNEEYRKFIDSIIYVMQ